VTRHDVLTFMITGAPLYAFAVLVHVVPDQCWGHSPTSDAGGVHVCHQRADLRPAAVRDRARPRGNAINSAQTVCTP
jgi:hypothetical protein